MPPLGEVVDAEAAAGLVPRDPEYPEWPKDGSWDVRSYSGNGDDEEDKDKEAPCPTPKLSVKAAAGDNGKGRTKDSEGGARFVVDVATQQSSGPEASVSVGPDEVRGCLYTSSRNQSADDANVSVAASV